MEEDVTLQFNTFETPLPKDVDSVPRMVEICLVVVE